MIVLLQEWVCVLNLKKLSRPFSGTFAWALARTIWNAKSEKLVLRMMSVPEVAAWFAADDLASHVEISIWAVELELSMKKGKKGVGIFTSKTLSPFFLILTWCHSPSMTSGGSQYGGSGTQKESRSSLDLRVPWFDMHVAFAKSSEPSHRSSNRASLCRPRFAWPLRTKSP